MNFEKIEMYGFKSFADKAEIKFGDGITGIVGPNGCGKSNVADAIRWVLGEQSAKQLRGSSMQDVIFSGTQGRKSLSYCEVSLYFDNSNRMFSIDYNEVIITRKLFRSGESEYYINKQPSRLRDILDLLHECGIGKEGYTIIGQGKVEEIMSAKPEDRRMIFEEATGIAKFKTRKNESQRKLERTHENLVRYLDILSEIENQLGPLERQAEKAREFNELSAQLKHHEINTYIAKVDGVETAKAKITIRIKGIDEQSELRSKELEVAQKDYDDILKENENADIKLRHLNDESLSRSVAVEKSSGAQKLFGERISFITDQMNKSSKEIEENKELKKNCEKTISQNKATLKELESSLKETEIKSDKTNKQLLSVSEKIALGEELANTNRQRVIESIESLADIKVNKGTISTEKNSLMDKLSELKDKESSLTEKLDKIISEKDRINQNTVELGEKIESIKQAILDKEDEVRGANEDVAKADNTIYTLNSHIASLVTKVNFYKDLKDNYEGYIPSVKLLLNKAKGDSELKKRIKGVVAELIKSDKKYDIALETVLAAAAQNVVTATTGDAKYLIEYLKANRLGRVTFLPIASVKPRDINPTVTSALNETGALGVADKLVEYDKEYYNIISNLLGNTLVVDTLANAERIANKFRFAFRIVTLEGDLLTTQGAMSGGSRKQDSGILSNDRKIEDLETQLSEKKAEMDKIKAEKIKLEGKRDMFLDQLAELNKKSEEARQQLVVEKEKLVQNEISMGDVGREAESNSELINVVKEKILKIDEKYSAVDSGSKKLQEDKESAKNLADKQQAEYDALRKQRDALAEEGTALQVAVTEIRAKIGSLKEENVRLSDACKEAEDNVNRLTKSIDGALQIIEEIKREQEKVALTKEELDELNKIRAEIDNIEEYKNQLKVKLAQNNERKNLAMQELSDLTEKRHAEEINLAKIDSEIEYMQQSIWEDYQETYETAKKYREENYDAKAGEQEINRIRRKRHSLGAINATAIDDYKALKERYEEMITQKEDLEKAEFDLQTAIDKIKSEMLTQFDEGFKTINENFQRIFKELFGGGRAMLELDYTNVEDKLEAGVEIIAEPPGKKLQKLSLLSGGEKALTAIAILFSILKLRPMPFCVLDEIEAALDEANVDRFARYLKKFSKETQFIVITHRKPTMELADALFGVTMQEKGVSKTVSVKLSDVVAIDELAQ